MKTVIRRNIFETNSSSAHVLSMVKEVDFMIKPSSNVIQLEFNDYGWYGPDVISYEDKLNYLYALAQETNISDEVFLETINEIIPDGYTVCLPVKTVRDYCWEDYSGIDHQSIYLLEEEGVSWEDFLNKPYKIEIRNDNE